MISIRSQLILNTIDFKLNIKSNKQERKKIKRINRINRKKEKKIINEGEKNYVCSRIFKTHDNEKFYKLCIFKKILNTRNFLLLKKNTYINLLQIQGKENKFF